MTHTPLLYLVCTQVPNNKNKAAKAGCLNLLTICEGELVCSKTPPSLSRVNQQKPSTQPGINDGFQALVPYLTMVVSSVAVFHSYLIPTNNPLALKQCINYLLHSSKYY
jgi:hypothetical protein